MTTVTASGLADNTQYTFKLMRPAAVDSQDPDTVISTTVSVSSGSGTLSLDLPANVNNTYYWADFGDPLYTFAVPASGGPYAITDILITPVRAVVRFPVETVNGHTGPNVTISATDIAGDFVVSVNGHSGTVTLTATDVDALPSATDAADIGALPAVGTYAAALGGATALQGLTDADEEVFTNVNTFVPGDPPSGLIQIHTEDLVGLGLVKEITQNGNTYDPTDGVIALDPFTDELADLTDVDISSPTNGQLLQYNSTAGKWENVTPSTPAATATWRGAYTPANSYAVGDMTSWFKGLYSCKTAVDYGLIYHTHATNNGGAQGPSWGASAHAPKAGDQLIFVIMAPVTFTDPPSYTLLQSFSLTGLFVRVYSYTLTSTDISNNAAPTFSNTTGGYVSLTWYIWRGLATIDTSDAATTSTDTTAAVTTSANGVFFVLGMGVASAQNTAFQSTGLNDHDGAAGFNEYTSYIMGWQPMLDGTASVPHTFALTSGTLSEPSTYVLPLAITGAPGPSAADWDLMVQGS